MRILVTQKQLANLVENKEKIILNESYASPSIKWFNPLGSTKLESTGDQRFRASRGSRPHAGIDVGVSNGSPLYNIGDGVVIAANKTTGACAPGIVKVQHADGIVSKYCHVDNIMVKKGDKIGGGCQFGEVAKKHMHWVIMMEPRPGITTYNDTKYNDNYVDPYKFYDANRFLDHNGEYCGTSGAPMWDELSVAVQTRLYNEYRIDKNHYNSVTDKQRQEIYDDVAYLESVKPLSVKPKPFDNTYFTKKDDNNGERVEVLQKILTASGYDTEVDGDYGNLTMDSVREVKDDLDIDTVATYVLNKELIEIVNEFGEIRDDIIEIKGNILPIDLSDVIKTTTSRPTTTTSTNTTSSSSTNQPYDISSDSIIDIPGDWAKEEPFNLIIASTKYVDGRRIRKALLETRPELFDNHNFVFSDRDVSIPNVQKKIKKSLGIDSTPRFNTITSVGASFANLMEQSPFPVANEYDFIQPYVTDDAYENFIDNKIDHSKIAVYVNIDKLVGEEIKEDTQLFIDSVSKEGGKVNENISDLMSGLKYFFKNDYLK